MIRRTFDVEPIDYQPGRYRVIEKVEGKPTITHRAGIGWMEAQAICGLLEGAVQRFIEDNDQLFKLPLLCIHQLGGRGYDEDNRITTVLTLAECLEAGGTMNEGRCSKQGVP